MPYALLTLHSFSHSLLKSIHIKDKPRFIAQALTWATPLRIMPITRITESTILIMASKKF